MTATTKLPKILQICAHYPPSLGGMEKVAESIATELARLGNEVEVITTDIGHTENYRDADIPGYSVTRIRGRMIANLPVAPGLLWRLLRQPRGSLYHVHIAQAGFPEITLLAALLRGGTTIGHFHLDVEPSGTFGSIFKTYKRMIFPWVLRRMHHVIVFSSDQRRLVLDKYRVCPEKVHVLPNGVSEDYFYQTKRSLHTPARLLFVGRLSPQKNVSLLLRSLVGISDKFETTIVGDGELGAQLERQAAALQLSNVTFVGRRDGDALKQSYEDADILVLPSEREGMPLALLEGMAMRLPAVATDVLGTRDWVRDGKTGYLSPSDDADAMRESLLRMLDREKYLAMSDQALRAVAGYSWPALAKRLLEEVYE